MSKTYLGVDIGGTAVKLGLVDDTGRVLRRAERSVSFDGYKTPILDTVQAAIRDFLGSHDVPKLEGIGVSATGQIDSRRGVVAGTCGNFPGWIGVDIKGTLEREFGLPVTVANDAPAAVCWRVRGALAVSWDISACTRWTAWPAPAVPSAAMSGTPPRRRWCAVPRRWAWTPPTAARSLRQPPQVTPARWLC